MALSKIDFANQARDHMREAGNFWHNWRVEAIDCYDFICGKQWLSADEGKLNAEKRPTVTFNYSEKMIDAVVGAEVSNRQEATYKPRGVEDSPYAEMMNNAAKWVRDECGAEDEESDAFRDMLICGLGWTYTHVTYDEDQDGKIVTERIDPLEMYSDPAANKPGITDCRFHFRRWWVDEREAKREWPGSSFSSTEDSDASVGIVTRGHRYEEGEPDEKDRHKGQVQITLYECVEREPIYRALLGGEIQEMSVADFNDLRDIIDQTGIKYVKQQKRVYYRGFFSGETLLDFEKSPCQDGFAFQAITGKRDRNKNTFYGLTRVMKDPQRWANKWLSQILHIINSNAKGGLMAEINAFVDPKRAQEEWAQPDSVTLFQEGALSGGKVKEKGMGAFPSGLDKLMQFALGSLPMVTGINLEALGLANREQAGVLEAQRKQAAYGLLAPLFDSLRRYRKVQGRIMLYLIKEYISDGRLVRIGGPDSQQFLPLTKQPDGIRYDIIVDQSPNAPDVKERTWEALMQLVPSMLKAGMPLPPDLLDYAPLPVALSAKWKKFAAESKQPDPAVQQQLQQLQQEVQKLGQENQGLKQDASIEQAQLQQKGQQIEAELMLKQKSQMADIQLKRELAQAEFQLQIEQQAQDLELARRAAENDMQIARQKAEAMVEVARISALNNLTTNGA
jgi:hypothetical protein